MIMYPANSALTVRQRIQKAFVAKRKNDPYVKVHDNGDGDGFLFGFYLSDWDSPFDDFQSYPELDFRVDTESKSQKYLNLGVNYSRKTVEEAKS